MKRSKLIVVEGIPGSGKTSLAQSIQRILDERGVPNRLFLEGDPLHPADFESVAHFTRSGFGAFLERWPQFRVGLERQAAVDGEDIFLGYRTLQSLDGQVVPDELTADLAQQDVYETPLPETYCRLALRRWQAFAEMARAGDETYIFECCLMQNPLAVLMIRHGGTAEVVGRQIRSSVDTVRSLNPLLIYLRKPDPRTTLERMAKERPKEWVDYVSGYTDRGAWSKANGVGGFEGFIRFHEQRQEIELDLLTRLDVPNLVIDGAEGDWQARRQEAAVFLSEVGLFG